MAAQKQKDEEVKATPNKSRKSMTPEQAEKRGLDPLPYGKRVEE